MGLIAQMTVMAYHVLAAMLVEIWIKWHVFHAFRLRTYPIFFHVTSATSSLSVTGGLKHDPQYIHGV